MASKPKTVAKKVEAGAYDYRGYRIYRVNSREWRVVGFHDDTFASLKMARCHVTVKTFRPSR